MKPKVLILDVDGVMTDGKFYYSESGKAFKAFGPDDHDALSLLKPYLQIHFVTGDERGLEITRSRIERDMGMALDLVSTTRRIDWIKERWKPEEVIYMGDGIFDHYVFKEVGYSIAPGNADQYAKKTACFVTERTGGDRAVAEAALHILSRYFKNYDQSAPLATGAKMSGKWSV